MSIAGYPTDPGDQGPHDGSNRPVPAEPPPDNWDAQFTAIVSGITGSMRWEATTDDLDAGAADAARQDAGESGGATGGAPDWVPSPGPYPRLDTWRNEQPDTAESRRLRRELRRQERAAALAAHLQAKAELEAELAADDEHFVPPPPPPLPRLRRRTVAALLLIAVGILLLAWPALLPAAFEVTLVLALLLILGGASVLVAGMRRHRGEPGEGWDDGAEV